MAKKKDYDIGYGKPPKHSRFKKGKSGNPKGRTEGAKNLKTDLLEELQESVVIRDGGGQSEITKQRAVIKRLVAEAAGGNIAAVSKVADLVVRQSLYPTEQDEAPPTPDEEQAFATLRDRIRREIIDELGGLAPPAPEVADDKD